MKQPTAAIFSLHIAAIFTFIIGAITALLAPIISNSSSDDGLLILIGLLIIGISIGIELVIFHLKKGKRWAWQISIGIGILSILTIYSSIFGLLILISLSSKEIRENYQKNINS